VFSELHRWHDVERSSWVVTYKGYVSWSGSAMFLMLQWYRGLNYNCWPGWRNLKLIVPFNACALRLAACEELDVCTLHWNWHWRVKVLVIIHLDRLNKPEKLQSKQTAVCVLRCKYSTAGSLTFSLHCWWRYRFFGYDMCPLVSVY
jgi:hypothetical protein